MRMTRVPILSYHALDDSGAVTATRPDQFTRQMEHLARAGYQALTVSEWIEGLRPLRPVVITFDDGFRSVAEVARPVLERLGFRATVYVTAQYCGGRNDWPTQPAAVPRAPLLAWDEVRALIGAGLEIGSHTLTHPPLTRLSPPDAEREIARSKQIIENETGQPVRSFAYPYGDYNDRVRSLVAAHYQSACGTRLGLVGPDSDPLALERVDAYYIPSPRMAARLGSRWMGPYLWARQMLRDLRGTGRYYRPAGRRMKDEG